MRRVVLLLIATAGSAVADEPTPLPAAPLSSGRPFREQIEDRLTELGSAVDGHLGPLTLDLIDLRVDGRAHRARVRVRGGTRHLSLRLDGDVHFRQGAAAIEARLELGLAGRSLRLELPDFEVVPRSYAGERYLEVRVPLIGGRF